MERKKLLESEMIIRIITNHSTYDTFELPSIFD
uniref:Uncharacterized protein n=1 Tax=Nelumbo nucifera TaxID=4432 RepID=A0A822Z0P3_NELNU|nr:TPA_asm: hypothetical protein HUJ06_014287 [Nelumbo nucifera]